MRATGIVRRIDDLGRIVIPKEIRRTMHIRESDPMEIFTDKEGQVILKKYSPIGEMTAFAQQYAESMAQVSGHMVLITDREQFIAAAGGCKMLLNQEISAGLEEKIEQRDIFISTRGERSFTYICSDMTLDYVHEIIAPIICQGDVIGSVVLLESDNRKKLGETDLKLAQAAAVFLGRQMEE